MTAPELARGAPAAPADRRVGTTIEVVVPVYNEEADLEVCVRRLHRYLQERVPFEARVVIADNASTDATPAIATRLAAELDGVAVVRLAEKGRGRALRTVWADSTAAVRAYMDVDLSTDLAALLPLVAPLVSGHSDLAIGSRLSRGARIVRGPKREVLSRGYNLLLRGALAARFSDAQCGFKAIRGEVADRLLPLTRDDGWFFDTELLVLAERAGLRIHEVPVDWVDDADSRVDVVPTVLADLRGVLRLSRGLLVGAVPVGAVRRELGRHPLSPPGVVRLHRQLGRFAAIGVASTLAYLLLFIALRADLGAQLANLAALLATAIANTALNRRLTFGITGRHNAGRHQLVGLLAFGVGLGLTSVALLGLHAAAPHPGRVPEVAVLVLANLAATLLRFAALRHWLRPDDRGRADHRHVAGRNGC